MQQAFLDAQAGQCGWCLSGQILITGGSSSVMLTERALRKTAATLRESLRAEAARRWGCSPDEVRIGEGYCTSRRDPGRRLSDAELAADRSQLALVAAPALKPPPHWQVAGQALPRIDLPAKVKGATNFGADVRLPGTSAISATNLSKRYRATVAVDSVPFQIPRGVVCGVIGPNGAGKTTLMRMLLGLVRPSSGQAEVLGASLARPAAYLGRVGALIEAPAFYPGLSGQDNLRPLAPRVSLLLS